MIYLKRIGFALLPVLMILGLFTIIIPLGYYVITGNSYLNLDFDKLDPDRYIPKNNKYGQY